VQNWLLSAASYFFKTPASGAGELADPYDNMFKFRSMLVIKVCAHWLFCGALISARVHCKCWDCIEKRERADGHVWACKCWECIEIRERTDGHAWACEWMARKWMACKWMGMQMLGIHRQMWEDGRACKWMGVHGWMGMQILGLHRQTWEDGWVALPDFRHSALLHSVSATPSSWYNGAKFEARWFMPKGG